MSDVLHLSSDDWDLLASLEKGGSLQALSEKYDKDISVLSRQVRSLSLKAPVLEKIRGKWRLTSLGKRFADLSRRVEQEQKLILGLAQTIVIGAPREFAARILVPGLAGLLGPEKVSVFTTDLGLEKSLLSESVDLAFECGRPQDPEIAFKTVLNESFVVIYSKNLLGRKIKAIDDLVDLPYVAFDRIPPSRFLERHAARIKPKFYCQDIAVARAACLQGMGWTLLPTYTVRQELGRGELFSVAVDALPTERYGVWWLRSRVSMKPWVDRSLDWLKKQTVD